MNTIFKVIEFILRKFNKCLVFEVELNEFGIEKNNVIKKIVVNDVFKDK